MRLKVLVGEHAKALRWQEALTLWAAGSNEVTYNSLIAACQRGSLWQCALAVLKDLESTLQSSVISYSSCLSALERSQWSKALNLWEAMEEKKIEADVIAYNVAINACGEDWQAAIALLVHLNASRLKGSVISYNTTISATEKAGQWQVAMLLMEELTCQMVPDIITYNAVISACAKDGQWQQAMCLYQALLGSRLQPTVITCSSVVSACEKGGQWHRALRLLEDLPRSKVQANIITFNSAISACEKCGQWGEALRLMDGLKERGLSGDVVTFNSTISACEKGAEWRQSLHQMRNLSLRHLKANVISYNSSWSAQEECGQWLQALRSLEQLHQEGVSTGNLTCNSVISACEKANHWPHSLWLLGDLHHLHDLILLTCGLAAFHVEALWRPTLQLLRDWPQPAELFAGPTAAPVESLAVTACVKQRKWRESVLLREHFSDQRLPASALTVNLAIDACEKLSYWSQALGLLKNLEDQEQSNAISYGSCLSACDVGSRHRAHEPRLCRELQTAGLAALATEKRGGAEDIATFRAAFGLAAQDPALPLPRREGATVTEEDCSDEMVTIEA
ncbi:Pentatricopeptide repeat-containing protein At2g31400 [Durusdinium trenchii]|uniref:Chloroplastic n=1 Tax=Durusdinium trenchii TaxID=1381693 RepID=A0ABP0QLK7_9DINO